MVVDLTSTKHVQNNTFVRIDIPDYQVLRFSDYHKSYDINSETYDNLGNLVSVSSSSTELRASPEQMQIAISGIPANFISDILAEKIKGSDVQIHRALFNPVTGALLSISDNPTIKFRGVVTNFEISNSLDEGALAGSIVLIIEISSIVDILQNKVTGRRTNPIDQKALYATDLCFDRVPSIAKSNFNFGAPE
jgi:hypothetical protein